MQAPKQDPEDRLLAHGRLSGPQLDEMWKQLLPAVTPQRARWNWARWVFAGAVPVMATALVLVWPAAPQPRGTPSAVLLETSCGAKTSPCHAGTAVQLKVTGSQDGNIHVMVRTAAGWEKVGRVSNAPANEQRTVENVIVVETQDVEAGLDVTAWWVAPPSEGAWIPPANALVRHLEVVR